MTDENIEALLEIVAEACERIEREVPPGVNPQETLLAVVLNSLALCCDGHKRAVVRRVRAWLAEVDDEAVAFH